MKRPARHHEYGSLTPNEAVILLALAKGPQSGYELIEQCRQDTKDELKLSHGTLYPTLKRLETRQLIKVSSQEPLLRSARRYRLTRSGRRAVGWELDTYRRMIQIGESRL